jgi:hypothetical protein
VRYWIIACCSLCFVGVATPIFAFNRTAQVEEAIHAAQQFLVKQVLIEQYSLISEVSDGTVPLEAIHTNRIITAYFIASALQHDFFLRLVRYPLALPILAMQQGQVWGYGQDIVADADDTAFALQTLFLLGLHPETSGLDLFYQPLQRAYGTFASSLALPLAIHPETQYNKAIHPEVNANVFKAYVLLKDEQYINDQLMTQFQTASGAWPSYFYVGPYYSTYLNLSLLCQAHANTRAIKKGLQFIAVSQNQKGSWGAPDNPYDTALALNTLFACHADDRQSVERGIAYLLSTQQPTGDWVMQSTIWRYVQSDRPYVVLSARDTFHVLTTALALKAMQSYLGYTKIM